MAVPEALVHRHIQVIHFDKDLIGALGPDEGLGVVVVLGEVAVDRRLQLDDRAEDPRLRRRRVSAEKASTALSHEPEVGVKWKVQRGCRASQARTLGCLWAA